MAKTIMESMVHENLIQYFNAKNGFFIKTWMDMELKKLGLDKNHGCRILIEEIGNSNPFSNDHIRKILIKLGLDEYKDQRRRDNAMHQVKKPTYKQLENENQSLREKLALFGQSISSPFEETATNINNLTSRKKH